MKRIGLLADTHGYLDEIVFHHFKNCDEVWHAGDVGNSNLIEKIEKFKPLRGVFGNVDGLDVRSRFPETLVFQCEEVKVYLTHIGGSPPKYPPGLKKNLKENQINLFISGHSHMLKIVFDEEIECLHINPGAAGRQGWHQMKTIVRFSIEGDQITNCEVIELGLRGKIIR